MLKMLVSAIAAMALLTACGGTSSDGQAKPRPTPAPRTYTVEQLKKALPKAHDIEDGLKIMSACPEDKKLCRDLGPGIASVTIALQGSTPELTEKQANLAVNVVEVMVRFGSDEAAAKSQLARRMKSSKRYVGAYDIPRKKLGDGYIPSEKGSGKFSDVASGAFTGFRVDRTSTSEAQGRFYASNIDVRKGAASVTVTAFLGAEGRSISDVEKLADQVLADYFKRLG